MVTHHSEKLSYIHIMGSSTDAQMDGLDTRNDTSVIEIHLYKRSTINVPSTSDVD